MLTRSTFTDPAAVEAWDAWFRWREEGRLRDLTIDSTWQRVASMIGRHDDALAGTLIRCLSAWQVLPDERILASAGTGVADWSDGALHAALNVAAFVRAPRSPQAHFDAAAFIDAAGVAVRTLEAATRAIGPESTTPEWRVGAIGFASALVPLGVAYDDAAAAALARTVGHALAEGCARASTRLAREHGARSDASPQWLSRAAERGVPEDVIADARRYGLRRRDITAIDAHPRLAQLANNVTDALDPLPHDRMQGGRDARTEKDRGMRSIAAQLAIRAAMQPWIDRPIEGPLLLETEPDDTAWQEMVARAQASGLHAATWRKPHDRKSPIHR